MINVTVLIDDSDIDLFIQKRFLEVYNFSKSIVTYKSADDALLWLEQMNGEEPPDVIFLDLNMPKTDGFMFLDRFNLLPERITGKVKIIILTSSNSNSDAKQTLSSKNVIHFITKPIKQSDIDQLKTLLGIS